MRYPEISGNLNKSKYAKGILVTDFDGTLYRSNKTIGKDDLKTLYYLKKHGYLCVIATGRSLFSFTRATKNMNLPIDYLIFSSGAGIQSFYDKKIIRALTHKTESVKKITNILISLKLDS